MGNSCLPTMYILPSATVYDSHTIHSTNTPPAALSLCLCVCAHVNKLWKPAGHIRIFLFHMSKRVWRAIAWRLYLLLTYHYSTSADVTAPQPSAAGRPSTTPSSPRVRDVHAGTAVHIAVTWRHSQQTKRHVDTNLLIQIKLCSSNSLLRLVCICG